MTTRLSLSWLNVFLIVGLVAAGAGLWNSSRKDVDLEGRLSAPREDDFQLVRRVPTLQTDLERTRSEFAAPCRCVGDGSRPFTSRALTRPCR